ncbi:MAG: ABC transporter permease [Xanthomonadales bacterium]|nr:ABC transporter permease [Xanthomonadales bacterium]
MPGPAQTSALPPGSAIRHLNLLRELVRRDLRQRYLGTFSGAAWALLQPLMLLAIYGYVFGTIFRARLPEAEFGELGFVTFLAIGLWPWTAFAESLARASTAIPDNAGLLGKVALPRSLLVLVPVASGFLLHLAGFAMVVMVLLGLGWLEPRWSMLWLPPLFLLLSLFTLGLAWLFAALSVFVRDFSHMLGQALVLLFFLTPVLYPRSLVPPALQPVADGNPMALFVALFRQAALGVGEIGLVHAAIAVLATAASLLLGLVVFRRLAPHFEDFL